MAFQIPSQLSSLFGRLQAPFKDPGPWQDPRLSEPGGFNPPMEQYGPAPDVGLRPVQPGSGDLLRPNDGFRLPTPDSPAQPGVNTPAPRDLTGLDMISYMEHQRKRALAEQRRQALAQDLGEFGQGMLKRGMGAPDTPIPWRGPAMPDSGLQQAALQFVRPASYALPGLMRVF